jgi:hypothetical protein
MVLRKVVDIYSVGWLRALLMLRRNRRMGWRMLGREFRYCLRQARAGNWRAVKNAFSGYLAEHREHDTSAGTGWTKQRAMRRLYERVWAEERAYWTGYYETHPDAPQ